MLNINRSNLGDTFSKLRDFLIALGLLTYILGYGVWAIVAWSKNLGPLPALDTQYFVAGFPTLFAFLVVILVIIITKRINARVIPSWLDQLNPNEQKRREEICLLLAVILPIIAYFIVRSYIFYGLNFREIRDIIGQNKTYIIYFFLFLYFIIIIEMLGLELLLKRKGSKFKEIFWGGSQVTLFLLKTLRLYLYLIPTIVIFLAIQLYIFNIYPIIPQSLGGASPRCAQIDAEMENYSYETLQLLGIDKNNSGNQIIRSEKILVHFYTSNFILLSSMEDTDVRLELERKGINAIVWCDKLLKNN